MLNTANYIIVQWQIQTLCSLILHSPPLFFFLWSNTWGDAIPMQFSQIKPSWWCVFGTFIVSTPRALFCSPLRVFQGTRTWTVFVTSSLFWNPLSQANKRWSAVLPLSNANLSFLFYHFHGLSPFYTSDILCVSIPLCLVLSLVLSLFPWKLLVFSVR